MGGSMPLLSHTFSGGTEEQFYPFSYSPIVTKHSKVRNELGRLYSKKAYRKKNLLIVRYGTGYTTSSLKSTNFFWTFLLCDKFLTK